MYTHVSKEDILGAYPLSRCGLSGFAIYCVRNLALRVRFTKL